MPDTLAARVALTLRPHAQESWPDVAAPILRWLIQDQCVPIPRHVVQLLLQGGEFDADDVHLRTAASLDEQGHVLAWALDYNWGEGKHSPRRWHLAVGLARREAAWNLSLAIRHGLPVTYLGPPLPLPAVTVPKLILDILRDERWSVPGVGPFAMGERQHRLPLGQGHLLRAALDDPDRRYPIVYISRAATGKLLLDAGSLARALAGSAIVLVAESPDLDTELDWLIPVAFKCVGGALRVYLPGIRLDDDADAAQHRYLGPPTLATMNGEVAPVLAAAITRWADGAFSGWLTGPTDLHERVREARLAELRARELADVDGLREYVRLMEEENTHLHQRLDAMGARFDQARDDIAQVEELKARLQAMSAERDKLRQVQLSRATADEQAIQQQAAILALRELPETLPAILDLIARLFPARVWVTPRAYKSAEEAAIERAREGRLGWPLLHALATTLHDLVFAQPPVSDLETAFQQQTGIEVAFSEGKQTNRNERMMALRRDVDDRGEPINITPHLKLGSRPPRQLRVHFAIDRERRLLIIGHCGDHLETFGTQWNG